MRTKNIYGISVLFFIALLFWGIYESILGFFQWWSVTRAGVEDAVVGSFHNSGPYSITLSLILPLAWFYIMEMSKYGFGNKYSEVILRLVSLIFAFLSIIVLFLSKGRTGWIASIIGCSVVTYQWLEKELQISSKKLHVSAVSVIVLILLLIIPVYRFKKDSADGRLLIWKISMSMIENHPFTGIGHGAFASAYGDAQEAYFMDDRGTDREKKLAGAPDYPYNEYLHVAIEYGIIGLFVLIGVLTYAFVNLARSELHGNIVLSGMLASLCVSMFFSYPFHVFEVCCLGSCIILAACFFPRRCIIDNAYAMNLLIPALLFSVSFIICSSYFGKIGNRRYAYDQWHSLREYYNEERYEDVHPLYAPLYPYLDTEPEYLLEYGNILSYMGEYEKSNKILSRGTEVSGDPMFWNIMGKNQMYMGNYKDAEDLLYSAYYRIPHKKYPLYLLMQLYDKYGFPEKALEMAEKIISSPDKVVSEESEFLRKEAEHRLYVFR